MCSEKTAQFGQRVGIATNADSSVLVGQKGELRDFKLERFFAEYEFTVPETTGTTQVNYNWREAGSLLQGNDMVTKK
eukprot:gene18732-6138_t